MDAKEPIEWKIRFDFGNRVFWTDRAILIDKAYVSVVDFLPDGTEQDSEMVRSQNYRKAETLLNIPVFERVPFSRLRQHDTGNYWLGDQKTYNKCYIDLLLQQIPEEQLFFGLTGGRASPSILYHLKERIGVLMPFNEPLPKQRIKGLKKRAESGDANAQYTMGNYCWINYMKTPTGTVHARRWYALAASQGHLDACLELATYCRDGEYVEKDLSVCLALLEKAIEGGSKKAMRYRAHLIKEIPPEQYRRILKRNTEEFLRRFLEESSKTQEQRAEEGDMAAQYSVALGYHLKGYKSAVCAAKALKWYAAAAKQGHDRACLALGRCYWAGRLVEKDRAKSLVLFERAIELGSKEAVRWRAKLIEFMPPEQFRAVSARIAADQIHKHPPEI